MLLTTLFYLLHRTQLCYSQCKEVVKESPKPEGMLNCISKTFQGEEKKFMWLRHLISLVNNWIF